MSTEVVKDAFNQQNYFITCRLKKHFLSGNETISSDYCKKFCLEKDMKVDLDRLYDHGESLAKQGKLRESFDVYAHISDILHEEKKLMPLERLMCLAYTLANNMKTIVTKNNLQINKGNDDSLFDQLLCPVCEDILKYPVTSVCGHTFCRQCCFGRTQCSVCKEKFVSFPSTNILTPQSENSNVSINFEQNIFIKRLIEKWWNPQLRAAEYNDDAQRCLENNQLDDALKNCNNSLKLGK